MSQTKIKAVTTAIGLIISVFCSISCKDSSGKESRQSAASVNESGRLIQASRQQINMTSQELGQSAKNTSPGQREQQSQRVVDRLEQSAGFPEIEKNITQLTTNLEQTPANDAKALSEITSQILAACQSFMSQQEKLIDQSAGENRQRLQKAEKKLTDAIRTAQQAQNRDAQVGPELLLGTLKLLEARNSIGAVQVQDVDGLPLHLAMLSACNGIATEDAFAAGIKTSLPDKTIAAVEARLEGAPDQIGEPASMTAQFAQTEQKIQSLEKQQADLAAQLATHRQQAKAQQAQYLALMDQSEKAKGSEQYTLYEKAYRIRVGSDESGQPADGVIYHESQAELLEAQLSAVQSRLDYYVLQRQQLKQTIDQVKQTVANLKNSPRIEQVQKEVEQSQARRAELVSVLARNLDSFEKLEKQYIEARLAVVVGYDESQKAYLRASRAAGSRDFRKAKDYAEQMAGLTKDELAGFWQQDADHYATCAELMEALKGIPEISDRVATLQRNFQQQQQDAAGAASQRKPEAPKEAGEQQ